MQENQKDLLTYEEAAREIGIALGSLKQAINRGSLHPIKLPRERRKFLRREELHRYKGGKREQGTPHLASASSAPDGSPKPGAEHESTPTPRSFELERMRLLLLAAAIGWSSNSAAFQRAASDNAAAIRDTVIAALQLSSAVPPKTNVVRGKSSGPLPQGDTGDQVTTPIGQLYEILLRSGASSMLNEQALQEIKRLFDQTI